MMSLEDARVILRAGPKPGAENFVRHATAAAVIYMHDSVKRGTMTHDSSRPLTRDSSGPSGMRDIPKPTQDQPRYVPFERSREWLAAENDRPMRLNESWATFVTEVPNPGLTASADLVQTLEGDASSYFVSVDPRTKKGGLYRYRLPQQKAGMVGRSDGTTAQTVDHSYYRSLARQLGTLRETTGAVLKDINRQNREAWSKRDG